MAKTIHFQTAIAPSPTFGSLEVGEFFCDHRGELYMKIPPVYDVVCICNEIDCTHDLKKSSDIDTDLCNAIEVKTGALDGFADGCAVKKIDIELNIKIYN